MNKVGTFAGKGDVDIVRRAVALVSEYNKNSAKPAVTERNRLFRMEVMALETRSRLEADYGKDPFKVGGRLREREYGNTFQRWNGSHKPRS